MPQIHKKGQNHYEKGLSPHKGMENRGLRKLMTDFLNLQKVILNRNKIKSMEVLSRINMPPSATIN